MGAALDPVGTPLSRPGLAIRKLNLKLAIDGDPGRYRTLGAGEIAAAIADALSTALDPGDHSFWVIRQVRLKARSKEISESAIAEALAGALREAIGRVLRGEATDGVLRFPDRTSWLAQLLWDRSQGRAHGHWAYARHSALDAIPMSLVPRQLFAAEPEIAIPVLKRLHEQGRLVPFAAAIGEPGARALLSGLLPLGNAGPASNRAARSLAGQIAAVARSSSLPVSSERAALAAIIADIAGGGLGSFPPRSVVEAARRQASRKYQADEALPRAAGRRSNTVHDAERPSPPHRAGHEATPDRRPPTPPDERPLIDTAHAGVILLWRSVRLLGLEDLLPAEDRARAALTLAATLAGNARDEAWRDPALHWLTGFAPGKGDRSLNAAPAMAEGLEALLRERAAPRLITPVAQRHSGLRIEQDPGTEDWLKIASDPAPPVSVPGMRPVARDIRFFGISRSARRRPWALLARAAYGDFGRRLFGLERSSAAWLWQNVLAGWGQVEPGPTAGLRMPRVALDLVLRMTGIDGTRFTLADGRHVEICLGEPA